jgi:hypothetical protein
MNKQKLSKMMSESDQLEKKWSDLDLISFGNYLRDVGREVSHSDYMNWLEEYDKLEFKRITRNQKINDILDEKD